MRSSLYRSLRMCGCLMGLAAGLMLATDAFASKFDDELAPTHPTAPVKTAQVVRPVSSRRSGRSTVPTPWWLSGSAKKARR